MSVAINRNEINDVIHYGLGTPQQYIGFSPRPDFVDAKWSQHYAQYDPDLAKSLLDETGAVDRNVMVLESYQMVNL